MENTPWMKAEQSTRQDEIKSDWSMLTVVNAMSSLQMTWDQSVNFPVSRLRWLNAANAEREGGIEIVDQVEFTRDKTEADEFYAETIAAQVQKASQ